MRDWVRAWCTPAPKRYGLSIVHPARGSLTSVLAAPLTVVCLSAEAGVLDAQYSAPTTRYQHGVLGDDVEYGALILTIESEGSNTTAPLTITLPEDRVFEDLAPRLADVDLDGDNEVIVVETAAAFGAQLAVYDESGEKIAATPHIGRSYRWLAPVGAADLDGDGFVEIAYIDRPHLAKTLRVWRFREGKLEEVASKAGLTNHKIGEDFITSGVRDCGDGPEMITADARWNKVIASILRDNQIESRNVAAFWGPESMERVLKCE